MTNKQKMALMLSMEMFLSGCKYNISPDEVLVNKDEDDDYIEFSITDESKNINETVNDLVIDSYVNEEQEETIELEQTLVAEEQLIKPKQIPMIFAYLKNDDELFITYDGESKTIEKFQRVMVLEVFDNWTYVVTYDGDYGYLPLESLEYIPDTFVEVDITDQIVNLYKNNELFFTSDVVTGIDDKTPLGDYEVINKARNINLVGKDYVSFVSYWIDFKNHEYGLHDASWRTNFGGNIYKTNGSHGCVNLPVDVAPTIYDNVSIGTRVLIHR